MNNKDTFDILHSEFEDCPVMPDNLSKRNIVAKLDNPIDCMGETEQVWP